MSLTRLPEQIKQLLDAIKAQDDAAMMRVFREDAVVEDGRRTWSGAELAEWCNKQCKNQSVFKPINFVRYNDAGRLSILASGPNQVDATNQLWRFGAGPSGIQKLIIENEVMPVLPYPMLGFVEAVNNQDIKGIVGAFAEDALINDQLEEFSGKQAISRWATSIARENTTIYIIGVKHHYQHVIVTGHLNGNYDNRGLPDPLVLTFYFSDVEKQIVQLIILRNLKDGL
jgi:ketosteroid isomerase-like protein